MNRSRLCMSEGRVEKLYSAIRQMTVDFRLRPGERINEVSLARQLEASRTPLREALNRLAARALSISSVVAVSFAAN